jgi:hypothetical protein
MSMTERAQSVAKFLLVFAGPIVWFLHFSLVYATHTLLCTLSAMPSTQFFWLEAGLTAAAAIMLMGGAMSQFVSFGRRTDGVEGRSLMTISLSLTALSLFAILWTTLPLMWVAACGAVG